MKNEKNLYIIVAIVSILGCGFIYFFSGHESSSTGKVTYSQVDQLRKETKIRNEIQRKKVAVDNYKSAPSLSNSYRAVEEQNVDDKSAIKFESERNSIESEQALLNEEAVPANMLDVQINKRLVNDQKAAQLSAQQKRVFIENYKKQALAKGYLVELNDQLVVTKVQKVASPKAPASIPQEDVEIHEYEDEIEAE